MIIFKHLSIDYVPVVLPCLPFPPCSQDECGDWVTSLCPYGKSGCQDNEGDYDVVMPEPVAGAGTDPSYKVGCSTTINLPPSYPPAMIDFIGKSKGGAVQWSSPSVSRVLFSS